MEVTALSFRLLMLQLLVLGTQLQDSYARHSDAAVLRVTPNRLQHFEYESISFDCDGFDDSTVLKASRSTGEFNPECASETPTGSSCRVDRAYSIESGEYWCETTGGKRSDRVNITVTDGSVILESPVLPVVEGDSVTLRCRDKTNSTNLQADFYKDDVLIERRNRTQEMTIHNISMSNGGLYYCILSDVGKSPGSWLTVTGLIAVPTNTVSAPPPPPPEGPVPEGPAPRNDLFLLCVAVIIAMMVLVLMVAGFLHMRNRRVSSKAPQSRENNHLVSGDDLADDQTGVTYAVVVTKQKTADAADNLSLHLETNHSSKPESEGAADKVEASVQPVYAAVTIKETPKPPPPEAKPGSSSSTGTPNPPKDKDPNSAESEILYSAVHKATEKPD